MKKNILHEFLNNSLININKEIDSTKFEETKNKIFKKIFKDFNGLIKVYFILFIFQLILQIYTIKYILQKNKM